jgi:hypothetical protein
MPKYNTQCIQNIHVSAYILLALAVQARLATTPKTYTQRIKPLTTWAHTLSSYIHMKKKYNP